MARGEIQPGGLPGDSAGGPRVPILGRAALASFVVTLMVLEAVSRTMIAPLTVRGGFEQFSALVEEIRDAGHSPVILFLGTSHVQCAILPAVIERRLGLERGAVLNAGLGASAPYEQMRLYAAVEESLGSARLAVLETSPLYFNRGLANDARLRLDLDTRLHYPAEVSKRADWLAGWAFSIWDRRRTWRAVATRAVRSALGHAGLEWPVFDSDGYPGIPGAPSARGQIAVDADRASLTLFERYSFDDEAVQEFAALLARIRGHGTRVVLLEYPLFPELERFLETRYPDVKKREAAVLAGPLSSYPVLSVGHARAAELMADFRDAHHLTRTGAARFSAMLAELPEFRAMANAARVSATTSR
ncbi:MAG: hypothetical protein DMF78_20630 [Acidobacteria bacterium]|nr:MAG: hypothetical protein DMF78_20630 [Acidobacteriota bacterium]